jgi:hypothetical protein
MNNSMNVSGIYQKNEQTVNDIYLRTLVVGIDTFTSQQIADLEYIANQCPKCGGDAVYRARSLYAVHDPFADYDDEELCNPVPDPLVGSPSGNVDGYAFYPNPATNGVTIAINPGLAEVEREVQVRTAQGKLVGSSAVPMGTWRHRVGTEAIPAGLYFFTIIENGRTVHAEKVTIIK